MTTLTSRKRGSDFVKAEWDQRYTREAHPIKNMTGVAIEAGVIQVGYPLNNNGGVWETLDDAAEASCDGFFIDDRVVPALADNAVTALSYQVLVRGPAIVNLDTVPAPGEGGAYDLTALRTRMLALVPPIIVMREPTSTTEQTT